jgi:capsular polysaccharide transport system permease protein
MNYMQSEIVAPQRLKLSNPNAEHTIRGVARVFWRILLAAVFLAPTWLSLVYFSSVVTNRYVSQSSFVVRSSNHQSIATGLNSFLKLVGVSTSQDNSHAVLEYMVSPDAFAALNKGIDLKQEYGWVGADFLSRYPNIFYGSTNEEFNLYLKRRIVAKINPNTGICTISVEAFDAISAHKISTSLLQLGEEFVNSMNSRMRKDAIQFSEDEVSLARQRLKQAQEAVTTFRNREVLLDPTQSSAIILQLIAELTSELNSAEITKSQNQAAAPQDPKAQFVQGRIKALKQQIEAEKARLTTGPGSLADKISEYEKLVLDRQFAAEVLTQTLESLERAKADIRKQQLYLEEVVSPSLPDSATEPKRLFEFSAITCLNLIVLLVGWLLKNGIAEHAPRLVRRRRN